MIESIEVKRKGRVRRAKLYYLRDRRGKSARIAERTTGHGIETVEIAVSKTERSRQKDAEKAARKEAAAKAREEAAKAKAAEEAAAAAAAEAEAAAAASEEGAAEEIRPNCHEPQYAGQVQEENGKISSQKILSESCD